MDRQLAEWVRYAEADLMSAELLLKRNKLLFHISIYHAHQCAEKIMKGYLIKKGKELPKIYNLSKLLASIVLFDNTCVVLKDSVIELDAYYPKVRYPYGDAMNKHDAKTCFECAIKIIELIKTRIKEAG